MNVHILPRNSDPQHVPSKSCWCDPWPRGLPGAEDYIHHDSQLQSAGDHAQWTSVQGRDVPHDIRLDAGYDRDVDMRCSCGAFLGTISTIDYAPAKGPVSLSALMVMARYHEAGLI